MVVSTGIDLIEVKRIKAAIERYGNRLLSRVFTAREIEYCNQKRFPYQSYAARFAAKEAVFKALGQGWRLGMKWREIEVLNNSQGQPYIFLQGRVRDQAESRGIKCFLISLAHTQDYALCQLLALREENIERGEFLKNH
jgi:holo-[acyl-carrier protein] synthase